MFFYDCSLDLCVCIVRACMKTLFFFFFFKQKTAYEMRISDWSSDVCSSDLPIDQDIYAYILELARNPILWLLTVVFIGEIGRRHRNRIAELSSRLVETEQHIGTLDDAYRRLAEAKTRDRKSTRLNSSH